jgi:hypothetical protein
MSLRGSRAIKSPINNTQHDRRGRPSLLLELMVGLAWPDGLGRLLEPRSLEAEGGSGSSGGC